MDISAGLTGAGLFGEFGGLFDGLESSWFVGDAGSVDGLGAASLSVYCETSRSENSEKPSATERGVFDLAG